MQHGTGSLGTTAATLGTEFEDLDYDLSCIHPGIDLIRQGLRALAVDQMDADRTQTVIGALAGSDSDVLALMAVTIGRLTNPTTNPALHTIAEDRAKDAQRWGEEFQRNVPDNPLRTCGAEAAWAIDIYAS